jgi:predicted nucleic acid-binding Zn ribbon protein
MPTYVYRCESKHKTNHGEFEIEHSIKDKLDFCPKCLEMGLKEEPVTRLISGGTGFQLIGGGWAKDNYS